MKARTEIPALLNELGLTGEGVEIGVLEGDYSEFLLSNWQGKKLHLVDIWKTQPGNFQFTVAKWDAMIAHVNQRLDRFRDRYLIHRMSSVDAAKQFADESLDFIYIDADHHLAAVVADLKAWYPKLKHGGLFSGHDYFLKIGRPTMQKISGQWKAVANLEVKKAVDAFASANQIAKIELTEERDTNITWWWIKP